ncbi:MAG: PilW family protein, partial [Steroidobacterales bacterium]
LSGKPDDADGNGLPDSYTGIASAWVDPSAVPATALVVSVRFWLLIRSETAEQGFRDTNVYTYADRVGYAPNDNFRRLLVSRTIQLRNTLSIGP